MRHQLLTPRWPKHTNKQQSEYEAHRAGEHEYNNIDDLALMIGPARRKRRIEVLLATERRAQDMHWHQDAHHECLPLWVPLDGVEGQRQVAPNYDKKRALKEVVGVEEPGAGRLPVGVHHVEHQAEQEELEAEAVFLLPAVVTSTLDAASSYGHVS